jgi:hypothetical protein
MKDLTEGKLTEALAYAVSIKDDSLHRCIDRLKLVEARYAERGEDIETNITTDFAPYSFYFVRYRPCNKEHRVISNGGIIFHGAHDNGGDGEAPTFSVNLTPTTGWTIHT